MIAITTKLMPLYDQQICLFFIQIWQIKVIWLSNLYLKKLEVVETLWNNIHVKPLIYVRGIIISEKAEFCLKKNRLIACVISLIKIDYYSGN